MSEQVASGQGVGGQGASGQMIGGQGAGASTTVSSGADWTSGMTDDHRQFVAGKGFKDPAAAIDSYRNLEKLLGGPKEKLFRIPDKEDAPEWGDIYNRLGRPEKADDYKLDLPNQGGDEAFAGWARKNFHELGLTRKQAEGLASRWNEYATGLTTQQQSLQSQEAQIQELNLKKEWGGAFDQNMAIAKRAVNGLGIDAKTIDALEGAMGFAGVMKFFQNLGAKLGEDSFVSAGSGSGSSFSGAMTPLAAQQKIKDLRSDSDFVKRYTSGDVQAKAEMERLHRFAYPEA